MKSNADKCHLLVCSNEKVTIKIASHEIANTKCENLLGSGLSFDYHISEICGKAGRNKVCALARVTCMSLSKKCSLMCFLTHCLTIVHLFGCAIVAKITIKSRLHERCLRIIYNDKRSSFNALLEKDGSVLINERDIKILATEMFKVSKNLAPPQMHEIFKLKDQLHNNLSYNSLFFRPLVKSAYKGTESLLFLGPKSWDILPDTYKDMPHLNSFKL